MKSFGPMKRLACVLGVMLLGIIPFVGVDVSSKEKDKKDPAIKFMRGARPTPFAKIIEALKSGKIGIHKAKGTTPDKVIVVPPRLSMWGNSQFGCCVSSESAFSMADYSTFVLTGPKEIFIPEATLTAWASGHGFLNGADLLPVIQAMQQDGIKDENGVLRKAGSPSTVDYTNEATLKSAIAIGPVSIAIDANALPSGAGNASGWYAFGGQSFSNTDHCVSLGGYGATADLFGALGVAVPSGAPAQGYFLYTWNTIGVVDHPWIMNTCVEAWLRTPTIVGLAPAPPPPPPVGTVTVVCADVSGGVNQAVKFTPTATGGTSPYVFLFDYGDGVQDASGAHAFKSVGAYKVTVTAVDGSGQLGTTTCTATIGSGPLPPPAPGGGLTITIPQSTPAGTYILTLPSDLDAIQNRLNAIRGGASKKR